MNYLIRRSFKKHSKKNLEESDKSTSLSSKSLFDIKGQRESDTQKTPKRKNLSITRNHLNTTVLGRLILHRKYDAALRRLKKAPREASIWVVGGTLHGSVRSRQLPIHMACSGLSACSASRTRLEQLLRQLALTFPGGCAQRDHEQRLPLHEALRHNASPETISLLLIALPEAIDETDIYGRLPSEINSYRMEDRKDEIAQMLGKDKHFWRSKRKELYAQFQHNKEKCSSTEFLHLQFVLGDRQPAKENLTILSEEDESSQMHGDIDGKTEQFVKQPDQKKSPEAPKEPQPAESNDDSSRLMQEIIRLRALEAEYESALENENLAKRVVKLEKEKSEMRLRIEQMVTVLSTHGLSPGNARGVSVQKRSGVKAKIAEIEKNYKNASYVENYKGTMFMTEVFATGKHHSSVRKTPGITAIMEDAKRDIIFLPDNYNNGDHGGIPIPDNAFEHGQVSKEWTSPIYNAQCSYEHMSMDAHDSLDNLLDTAEQLFGHTFSPGTVQAWRQIPLPAVTEESLLQGASGYL